MTKTLTILTTFFLLIISFPATGELFKSGSFTSHDLGHHIPRLIQTDRILREGQIPPRWTGDLNKGYGYPLLLFNYPLPYYIGEIFHLIGFNFIWSTKLVFSLSLIGSIFTAYLFFRELFGRLAGIVGAVFYLYAPIRFLNVYVSATIGNALAFMFVPLPFYALVKLKQGFKTTPIFVGALGMAGLVLSHNIMAYMFAPLIFTFFVYILLQNRKKNYVFSVMLFMFLGLGIAGYFWLPAVVEKQYIRYAEILPGFYNSHFPTLRNLVYMPWGYGFSWPGDDPHANPGRMSFQIGLAHLLVVGINLLLFFYLFIKKRPHLSIQAYFLLWFFISIFFMLRISEKIWDGISWMQYIQMPWRILAVAIFAAAGLAAYLISTVKMKFLTSAVLILLTLYANRNHWHINQSLDVNDSFYARIDGSTTMAGEHLPTWGRQQERHSPAKVEIFAGLGNLQYIKDTSAEVSFKAKISMDSTLLFNQFYFPGWRVFVDGADHPFVYRSLGTETDGLIKFNLKRGLHLVKVKFTRTPIRIIADLWSLLSIIVVALLFIDPKIQNKSISKIVEGN